MRLATTRLATILGLLLLAGPVATAAAQPPERVPRLGALMPNTRSAHLYTLDPFLQGLRERGWVEGKNVLIEYRWADGRPERLPDLVAELVRFQVEVIAAAKNATTTIPIVMATSGDVEKRGLVASLAGRSENVTGNVKDAARALKVELQLPEVRARRRIPASAFRRPRDTVKQG